MNESVRSGETDDPNSESDQNNKMFIVKILSEMHNTFNRSGPEDKKDEAEVRPQDPEEEDSKESPVIDDSSSVVFEAQPVNEGDEEQEKVEFVEEQTLKEPSWYDDDDNKEVVMLVENSDVNMNVPESAVGEQVDDALAPVTAVEVPQNEAPSVEEPVEESKEEESMQVVQDHLDEIHTETTREASPQDAELGEHAAPVSSGSEQFHDAPSGSDDNLVGDQAEEQADTLKRRVGRPCKVDTTPKAAVLEEEPFEKRPRRSLRSADKAEQDVAVKRSSRRMSKDYNRESVLQNAIARKEKSLISFSREEKPRRSSRLSEDVKTPPPQHRSPKSKTASRNSTSADESTAPSNGESVTNSPLRLTKMTSDCDQDDTSSDISSRSVKKTRSAESILSKSAKLSSKESLVQDEDSASSWQAQPALDALSRKVTDSPSRLAIETDRSESGSSCKEAFKKIAAAPSPKLKMAEGCEPPSLKDEKNLPPLTAGTGLLCECEVITTMFAKDPTNQLCKALDIYEHRLVKCSNEIGGIPLLRSCKTKPFQALCRIHFERMIRHNACPTCGIFCTQGVVNICENKHFFHKDCDMKLEDTLVCPHCGTESYMLYKIQLQNHRYPLFLPSTKPLSKLPVAKMSFSRRKSKPSEEDSLESELSEVLPSCSLTLPSGKVITALGIPLPEREKLEHLIKNAGPPDDIRYTYRSLYQAAKAGDAEKVLNMLGMGMSPNQVSMNPLMGAAREGHLLVVHLLVQAGANLETLDKNQYTPLMLAVQNKHNALVKYLVKAGAAVGFKGAEGMTALHIAAKEGNLEACHYILTQANLPLSFIDAVDDGRWTALVWAAENCHSKVVRYLLEKRADPQIRDAEMNIALHWSAFAGSMEISEDLLNFGCSINLSNTHGDTPLHIAARQGADNCVVLLLARGARVEMMNKAGQLPRDCVINKDSYCYTAIDLNMTIKKSVASTNFYPRILCNDVSGGREENPIQCVNAVDDDVMPTDYTYVIENCFTSNITIDRRISSLMSCKCEDNCSSSGCMCTKISRGCWYDNTGKLLPEFNFEDPPMLFECNPACGCNVLTCKNRVVQKGLKSRLQLCKTKDKSWGVITLKEIPKGSYVCEYIGEIISDLEADTRKDDSYLFDLDNAESETYCLDARRYGNVCRFINHSCRPNLSPVKIYYQHQDLHFPRIAMFASRDIMPNEELGFDYGEKFWIIKCKSFTCHCGEPTCRYSESTIQQTLEKYQQKLRELDEISDAAF
uniref:Histone-lysine N-methyltransferase EHMT1 n=4 Tax=Lygus hesperus TaxID=30085 RepID=A0A0A9Z5B7_LYGHE